MRPSIHLAKKPSGYGTRMLTHLPSTHAISDSLAITRGHRNVGAEPGRG